MYQPSLINFVWNEVHKIGGMKTASRPTKPLISRSNTTSSIIKL